MAAANSFPSFLAPQKDEDVQRARHLALRFGWNATSYQILNPGISLWFSKSDEAVAGYVDHRGVRVVAGAPVCPRESISKVAREMEADAQRMGKRICYFGAESRLVDALRAERRHAMVNLGAQPAWDPRHWSKIVAHRASLRAQLHRARNKRVLVSEISAAEASAREDLHRCLQAWLETRGLPSMHFLVESETLQRLFDRRIFVARQDDVVVGFAVASPVARRRGWMAEQIVRRPEAPNGTAELLLDAVARTLAGDGYEYFTLGLAPLSRRGNSPVRNPWWLRLIFHFVRAHGRRFYNFDGLDRFKAKFQPEAWEPVYAVSQEQKFSMSTLFAIASVFSDGGSPMGSVLRAMGRGLGMEARRISRALTGRVRS